MRRPLILTLLAIALPAALAAQQRPRPTPAPPRIPEAMVPPAGKCRIWMDDVSPAQQPAPTDCQTAIRQKPANATVIFGPSERDLKIRGFTSRQRQTRLDTVARRTPVPGRRETAPRPTGRPSSRPTKPDSSRQAPPRRPDSVRQAPPRRPDVPAAPVERPS